MKLSHTRSGALTIPEEGRGGRLCLVRPKTEPEPPLLPVKPEHLAMAAADETAMRWTREDYVREQVARQRRALEEHKAHHRRPVREVDGVLYIDSDEEEAGPSRIGDPGQGCSRDGGGWQGEDDDDDGGGDYTNFYKRLGM